MNKKYLLLSLGGVLMLASCGGTSSSTSSIVSSPISEEPVSSSLPETALSGRDLFDRMYDQLASEDNFGIDLEIEVVDNITIDVDGVLINKGNLDFDGRLVVNAFSATGENLSSDYLLLRDHEFIHLSKTVEGPYAISHENAYFEGINYYVDYLSNYLDEEINIDLKSIIGSLFELSNGEVTITENGYSWNNEYQLAGTLTALTNYLTLNKDRPLGDVILELTSLSKEELMSSINNIFQEGASVYVLIQEIDKLLLASGSDLTVEKIINFVQETLNLETSTIVKLINKLAGSTLIANPLPDDTLYDVIERLTMTVSLETLLSAFVSPETDLSTIPLMIENLLFAAEDSTSEPTYLTLAQLSLAFSEALGVDLVTVLPALKFNSLDLSCKVDFDNLARLSNVELNGIINIDNVAGEETVSLLDYEVNVKAGFTYSVTIDEDALFDISDLTIDYTGDLPYYSAPDNLMFETNRNFEYLIFEEETNIYSRMFLQTYANTGLPLQYFFEQDTNQVELISENDIKIGDATLEDYTFYGLACKKLSIDIDDNYFVNSGETSLGIELGFTMLNDAGEIMGYSSYEILRIIV